MVEKQWELSDGFSDAKLRTWISMGRAFQTIGPDAPNVLLRRVSQAAFPEQN